MKHVKSGNCWDTSLIYECRECGTDTLCDVCHKHDTPRGSCLDCKRCPKCDADAGHTGAAGKDKA